MTLEAIEGVEGWLSDAQARRLSEVASEVLASGRIVEIGSFRGRSTIVLALAAPDGVEVVAIDPHGGGDRGPQEIAPDARKGEADHQAFRANLARAGVTDRVRHVRAPSQEALAQLDGPVALLFVDGAHRYRPALADIERWGARVVPGGTMLIHDAFNAIGVMLAQGRLLFASRQWRYQGRVGSLAAYRRETLSPRELPVNFARQLAGVPWFVRNLVIKVLIVARLRTGEWPY